jgi:hypothetical protein
MSYLPSLLLPSPFALAYNASDRNFRRKHQMFDWHLGTSKLSKEVGVYTARKKGVPVMIPKKILFCADFSENSEPARELAVDYATLKLAGHWRAR